MIYDFRCKEGHVTEHSCSMSDVPASVRCKCGKKATRIFSAPAIRFKGSGFYTTDYRNHAKQPAKDEKTPQEAKKAADEKAAPATTNK